MGNRVMKLGAFAAILALAVAGFGGSAVAKKKKKAHDEPELPAPGPVQTVSTNIDLPAFTGLTVKAVVGKATCPPGTGLVGGGYTQPDPTLPSTPPTITSSRRSGLASWAVGAINVMPTPASLTVEAYCRANVAPLTEVSEVGVVDAAPVPDVNTGTIVATCPPGQKAVAGGAVGGGTPGLATTGNIESVRTAAGDGWAITGTATFFPLELTVLAYCSDAEVYTVKGATVTAPLSNPQELLTATATGCPAITVQTERKKRKKHKKGKKHGKSKIAVTAKKKKKKKKTETTTEVVQTQVVNGGYRLSPPDNTVPGTSLTNPFDYSRTSAGGWQVRALHSGDAAGTAAAEAYCMA